ncbi:MAG: helix-turn-helix transcriptional regulator [Scytonema sp. PMC 1069.18]|nr:helix-turn-helix transcriptional regulator [Scytonema sp. PMC 1069.18]MEC4886457.1 helix-turn-helix transcriptional regulator [Scytonema sp. PMC 1070.18]
MTITKKETLCALGRLVKQHRVNVGISQEELALRAHLDRTYVSGVERGVRNPSLTALVSLASGLGITVSELLEGLEAEVNVQQHRKN